MKKPLNPPRNLFGVILSLTALLIFSLVSTDSEASVVQGRQLFFNNGTPTYSGIRISNEEFKSAVAQNFYDQEANLFYSITRMLANSMNQNSAPDFISINTIGDLLGSMGMMRNNNDDVEEEIPFTELPKVNDDYIPPATLPGGEKLRAFLSDPVIDLLDASLANLAVVDTQINITLTAAETGDTAVEIDYGDVALYRSFLHMLKSFFQIVSAYNLDMDIGELINRANEDDVQLQRDLLDKYHALLKLIDVNGKISLDNAKQSLLKGITEYQTALQFIKSESDGQGDDLFYFDSPEDLMDAENFLTNLEELQNALNQNRPAVFHDADGEDSTDEHLDLNRLFGNVDKAPLDIRSVLPVFGVDNNIVKGSFPGNPVLNGIFTELQTGDDIIRKWELESSEPLDLTTMASPAMGQVPFSPSFSCAVGPASFPCTFSWDFGDGTTGTGENPSHTYTSGGNYRVIVTVRDSEGKTAVEMVDLFAVALVSMEISPSKIVLTQPEAARRLLIKGFQNNGTPVTPENIEWASSDSSVAVMEGDQVVAVAEGDAVVTASCGGITATADVKVSFKPSGIDACPALVFLEKDQNYIPEVVVIYQDGTRRKTDDFTCSIMDGSDSVSIEDKTITGVKSGAAGIQITSDDLTAEILINVSAPAPLSITPAMSRSMCNAPIEVIIDGGNPPYKADTGYVDKNRWSLTAPPEGGDYSYFLTDADGERIVFNLTVLEPLSISIKNSGAASSITLGPGESVILTAAGGSLPYSWFSTAGVIIDAGNLDTVEYTPPGVAGINTVTVTDKGGQTIDVTVSTIQALKTTPERLYLSTGQTSSISIMGGIRPYTATTDAGEVTQPSGGALSYTAPLIAGDYLIKIADTRGTVSRVYATVSLPLVVTPKQLFLHRNEKKIFKLAGGVGRDGDIFITALKGEVDPNPKDMTFTYEAPGVTGSDTLVITDMSGEQIKVNIDVTSDHFFVTPLNATMLRKEQRVFKIVGGTGDEILWTADQGDIIEQNQSDTKYRSSDILDLVALSAMDLELRKAFSSIHVISDQVKISPSRVYLKPGESAEFRGIFGTGQYEFAWTRGKGEQVESNILKYIAPLKTGIHYITVFDSAGNSAKAEAIVSGGTIRKKIDKTHIYKVTSPGTTPDSETQPAAVGDVQEGGAHFSLAFDFPNYVDRQDSPIPTNYYVALCFKEINAFFFLDAHGNVYPLDRLKPCMARKTDAVYTESLQFDYCNPETSLDITMYILAVESGSDPHENLLLEPADAPFELWYYDFSFGKCQLNDEGRLK